MFYAVAIGYLGYTRINAVICYNSLNRGFDELTPAQARRYIKQGELVGVIWKEDKDDINGGMFLPDEEGFNRKDIMVHSACKFRPLLKDVPGGPNDGLYNVVRVINTSHRGKLYEVVSNRHDRIKLDEKHLRSLNEISLIAGVWITDNEIKVADCIKVEDRTGVVIKEETPREINVEEIVKANEETLKQDEKVEEVNIVDLMPDEEVEETSEEKLTMDAIFGNEGVNFGDDDKSIGFMETPKAANKTQAKTSKSRKKKA